MLEDGRLRAVHRGVYAVGHVAPSIQALYMAAVLAGGSGATLSHGAAGFLLKLLRLRWPPTPEITVALGSDVTLSKLEDLFLALLKIHGLPLPRTNIDVEGDNVDCHWEQHGLTVELVTFRPHATRYGFETDQERRRRSSHVPYTYGDIVEHGDATVADLRQRLEQAAAAP